MNTRFTKTLSSLGLALALGGLAACSNMGMDTATPTPGMVVLSGAQEVPPVITAGAARGSFKVLPEGGISGSIVVTGMLASMAHIHQGAAGTNGPVIVPLVKTADGVWAVPPGTTLTTEQRKAYLDGALYVNVHSETHKAGEIRAQLKP